MFDDMFGDPRVGRHQEILEELVAHIAALDSILVEAGLATDEEIKTLLKKYLAEIKELKAENIRKWKEENPEQAKGREFLQSLLSGSFDRPKENE